MQQGKVSAGDKVLVIFLKYDDIAKDYERKIEERTAESETPLDNADGTCILTIVQKPAIKNAVATGSRLANTSH